jgi:hypothetical protein
VNANDLADRLEEFYKGTHIQKAADELRRLQAENDALLRFIDERGETGQLIIWKAKDK